MENLCVNIELQKKKKLLIEGIVSWLVFYVNVSS